MGNMINITINGKVCQAKEGEFILNVARANGIFIPAVCYQTKCTPTLACRLCLVEADGKQVYACNAKSKDGMVIEVNTENIEKERRAIMEVYDVNHPLQCGVCDQSGECELQNYSLYMKVDSQSYAVKDVNRPASNWGVMKYDPGLCIVCEKCVTICKDMIGSNALGTVKRGADALDKAYKECMPKDAYAMWNKLNKNLIGFDESKCIDCGECISVCPVGALVSSDFQYTSNAWELTKIPASNPHSSDCSLLYYEVKQNSIANNTEKTIYRVTNDAHYVSLSGAARFGFDIVNKASKDETEFIKAVEAFKDAESILFNSFITNEEAKILQLLKEKTGVKLVNMDAFKFKEFMKTFGETSGTSFYNGTLEDIHNSNFILSVGSFLKSDAPSVKYAFNNAIGMNKGAGIYFHPMGDKHIEGLGKKGKTIETIASNPLSEEAVLYFILDQFGENLPENTKSFLDSQKETRTKTVTETIKEEVEETVVDPETGEESVKKKMVPKKVQTEVEYTYTKLLDLIGTDESFLETLEGMLAKKDTYSLIIGEDCINHPQSTNIAKLVAYVQKYTNFKVLIIPSQTNTLGVSLICDLDVLPTGKTVGYNVKADYQLSSLGDGDLDMPVLSQQEGTFVNINKTVVPTNAAVAYDGYCLNDIANEILSSKKMYTIDYTSELFQNVAFDTLKNYYGNDRVEHRGYTLENSCTDGLDTDISNDLQILNKEESEYFIYRGNPINQFNEFTARANQLKDDIVALYVSNELAAKLEVSGNEYTEINANGVSLTLPVMIDGDLEGEIPYIPTFEKNTETIKLFENCRFATANIKKV
jgi:NADH-quinone oxidoreductase subunit G